MIHGCLQLTAEDGETQFPAVLFVCPCLRPALGRTALSHPDTVPRYPGRTGRLRTLRRIAVWDICDVLLHWHDYGLALLPHPFVLRSSYVEHEIRSTYNCITASHSSYLGRVNCGDYRIASWLSLCTVSNWRNEENNVLAKVGPRPFPMQDGCSTSLHHPWWVRIDIFQHQYHCEYMIVMHYGSEPI
jgi:hypothetical protein